jgi:enoyl-CoA hydratase/carnithine racemase
MSDFGIDVDRAAGVAWVTIRNPARRNAMRLEMWRELAAVMRGLDVEDAVRVVVMRGAGSQAFASGADISEFQTIRHDAASAARYETDTAESFAALLDLSKPLIAMIHGSCIGGGLAIALSADVRLAAADARFALPAARLGLGYHARGVERIVQVVGPSHAAEIFFAGLQYGADEALRMGLVNRTMPATDLEGFTRAYATAMALNAPLTQRAAKAAIGAALGNGHHDVAAVSKLIAACFESADYAEGVTAFLEKRPPKFTGR